MNKIVGLVGVSFLVLVVAVGSVILGSESSNELEINEETSETSYTQGTVALHNTPDDCWTIIEDVVYDVTEFIAEHPGGERILVACGVDGTTAFLNQGLTDEQSDEARAELGIPQGEAFHSPAARDMLKDYEIGRLER